ncbi:MAG TPA: hypothetical protein VGM13_02105 [Thermoanaerobaculia bacterium]
MFLAPRETRVLTSVVEQVFAAPESAGNVYVSWTQGWDNLHQQYILVTSKTFTRDGHSGGTYGFSVAGAENRPTLHAVFVGVSGNGGDLTSGFRTNVNLTSASEDPRATVTVLDSSGRPLGSPLTVAAGDGVQINDVFKAVGAGDVVTDAATLTIDATGYVSAYVTVIDNRSGDSCLLRALEDPGALLKNSSALYGTVTSNDPAVPVSGLRITVVQGGTTYSVRTSDGGSFGISGYYAITGLQPGPIRFTVDSVGACPTVTFSLNHQNEDQNLNPIICP